MRSFTASTAADAAAAVIPFELTGIYKGGVDRDGQPRDSWVEQFEATATPEARIADTFRGAILIDQDGNQGVNPAATIDFIESCLVPESAARFRSLINDPHRLVKLALLGEVFMWLSQEVVGRPTPPSSQSSPGQNRHGPTSSDGSAFGDYT